MIIMADEIQMNQMVFVTLWIHKMIYIMTHITIVNSCQSDTFLQIQYKVTGWHESHYI